MNLLKRTAAGLIGAVATLFLPAFAYAAESVIEEVIVTARQQAEGLQDVPVTIAAMTEEDLDRYNITSLVEAAKMVPNMHIQQAGSGNGTVMRLRGIGSSSISAAFDHSIAINIDGVVVNRGRFILNSYMDMGQLEVLKGPQSLYFGKSATAGVVSITTNDPSDEFEFQIGGGFDTDHDGVFTEMVISGPITDTLGARFAFGTSENDELVKNEGIDNPRAAINGAHDWTGDESTNARLTLVWEPTDNFVARLKLNHSTYDNDAGWMYGDTLCPEGVAQNTAVPAPSLAFAQFPNVTDCRINGNSNRLYLDPGLRAGLPKGYDDGVQGLEQETDMMSLRMSWDISDTYTLSSVTGYVDFDHWELDDYSLGAGVFGGLHNNIYESLSQEFTLSSNYDGPVNFQAGLYWQDIEQEFDAYQYAFNLPVMPTATVHVLGAVLGFDSVALLTALGFDPAGTTLGPDPATGNAFDYQKHHFLDTEAFSAYFAVYWDITDKTELTAGVRYTDEDKEGHIEVPYLHGGAAIFGWGVPPLIEGLEFDDSNTSPEIAVTHHWNDDVSFYVSYKEGFKSGGVDNSALPTAALGAAAVSGDFSFLIYDSEESEGWEIGMKGNFFDNAVRLNATAFTYDYIDLQSQLFDSQIIQFFTSNAETVTTEGFEFDLLWQTDIDGLSVRSAWAWTEAEVSESFINATGQDLKGTKLVGNAEIAGFVGFTYDFSVADNWRMSVSSDARYTDDYRWTATLPGYDQDSFWLWDAAVSMYSDDGRHEFSVIGRNLSDEIYSVGGGNIPGRCPIVTTPGCEAVISDLQDQIAYVPLGRQVLVRYKFTL